MLALEGIKVLDLNRAAPGSLCTMMLGDFGAEVIKVEGLPTAEGRQRGAGSSISPVGEEGRRNAVYWVTNRNKKSIALDLKSEEGRRVFYQLAEKADVIAEGFRPGVAKRLNIDYETIAKINPRIIYCSLTGYGQTGPYRDLPGHDINYISFSGALDLIGDPDGPPVVPLNLLADIGGGAMHAVIGILIALAARNSTGKGQYIDVSFTDTVISLMGWIASLYFRSNKVPERGGSSVSGSYPYYSVYETKDGKYITLGCVEPWLWENLCRAIGKEEFIPFHSEPDHYMHKPEGKEWQEVKSSLQQIFLTRTRDEWFDFLSQKDVLIAKVYSMDEVFTDPQVLAREMVIEVEHPTEGKIKQVGIPIKLSDTPGKVRNLSPILGEHTEEILASLGYDKQRINELRQAGAIN